MLEPSKLLLHIVFNDIRGNGRESLKRILNSAEIIEVVTFSSWKRTRKTGPTVRNGLGGQFDLAEASIKIDYPVAGSPLRFRYRPAPASPVWAHIGMPNLDDQRSGRSLSTTKLLMSMRSLEHPARSPQAKSSGVIQALCASPNATNLPVGIHEALGHFVPELMNHKLWGIANPVPFRDLTVEQEWDVARTVALQAEPLTFFDDQWNQILFATSSATAARLAHTSVLKTGELSIYELERPVWAK